MSAPDDEQEAFMGTAVHTLPWQMSSGPQTAAFTTEKFEDLEYTKLGVVTTCHS